MSEGQALGAQPPANPTPMPNLSGSASIGAQYVGRPEGWLPPVDANNRPIGVYTLKSDADAIWAALSPEDKIAIKNRMFLAGLYGRTYDGRSLTTALTTEADKEAWESLWWIRDESQSSDGKQMDWQQTLTELASTTPADSSSSADDETDLVDAGLKFQQDMKAFAQANGLSLSNGYIANAYRRVLDGDTSLEQEQVRLREKFIAGMYPAWKDEIMQGQNVSDIAAPYTETMAAMLDIPAASIELSDPLVKRALQGVGEDGKPGIVPMWQFESQIRRDSRWQDSPQGLESVADSLNAAYNEMMGMF